MTATASARDAFPPLQNLDLLRIVAGTPVYRYREFYDVKNALLCYDERTDYLNYGYWADGEATANPSAALVARIADRLALTGDDVLLNVGSGLGQPCADIARRTSVRRILGVNILPEQVAHANARFADAGLAGRVEHRVHDARRIGELVGEGITAVACIESLAEVPDLPRVLGGAAALLSPGGRIALCDVVRESAAGETAWRRGAGRALMGVTTALYGDHWRSIDEYAELLRAAGFRDVGFERIGEHVYPQTWRHAAARLPGLAARPDLPRSARLLAALNLRSLAALHARGRVDYAVIWASR